MTRAARQTGKPFDFNRASLPRVYAELSRGRLVTRLLELARDEDLGVAGDVTSLVSIGPRARGIADVVARSTGTIAGLAAAGQIVRMFAPRCALKLNVRDGAAVRAGTVLATLRGPMRQILAAERTLLNLVGRLSGIATRTAEFVRVMHAGTRRDSNVRGMLYDTRKTTPGLRVLEKYAVRCGGGACHRIGLHDAVLIKDNHIAGVAVDDLAEVIEQAAARARSRWPGRLRFIEVEVDTLEQMAAILTLPQGTVDIVLLDNMGPTQLRQAVSMRDGCRPRVELEASGGISLKTVRAIALSGVDRLSVGSLTHGASSLDVALDIRE